MQQLEIYQSLWALESRHPTRAELSLEEKFRRVADAGYAGLCLDPAVHEIEENLQLAPLFREFNLGCMVNAFPATVEDMQPLLAFAARMNACLVNVIGTVMPLQASEAVPILRRWRDEAALAGIELLVETHRDSTLNDLYFILEVLDLMPELRLCGDYSHLVIDREFRSPLNARDQAYMDRIIAHSDAFQGRVSNGEQIQVQIDFPQHQAWVQTFRSWWQQGITHWRQRSAGDATLRFLCELGPPPYAITDANGEELSDRWQEALTISGWVEEIWESTDIVAG